MISKSTHKTSITRSSPNDIMISKSSHMKTSTQSSPIDDTLVHQSINATLNYYTLQWWLLLCFISLINIAIWIYSYRTLLNDHDNVVNNHHPYKKHHLLLSGIYVFVCAYRSFLPRIDLERYCLWDTFASSIFLGRFFATIAEVSFATQIALFLYHLGQVHDIPMACKFGDSIGTIDCYCTGILLVWRCYIESWISRNRR